MYNCNCQTCLKFIDNLCTLKNIDIKDGKCLHIITNDISHAQHRIYRSILLPALTDALGETNNQYAHNFIIKPEFIYRQTGDYYIKVDKFDHIPCKHQGSARIITETETVMGDNTQLKRVDKIIGYVPSMSQYTKKEAIAFLKFCEILLEEIGGAIPTDSNQEYSQLRTQLRTQVIR